jgi:hypothetical protein
MGDVTRVAKEAIDAHRVVKVFNAQEHIRGCSNRPTSSTAAPTCGCSGALEQQSDRADAGGARAGLVLLVANREIASGTLNFADFGHS